MTTTYDSSNYALGNDTPILNLLGTRTLQSEAGFANKALNGVKPGGKLLDAGCGIGSITASLAKEYPNVQVTGIDFDNDQINIALEKHTGLENLHFKAQDVQSLDFDSDCFDAIFVHTLLMHVPNLPAVLAELYRVLKPGGKILIREGVGSLENLPGVVVGEHGLTLNQLFESIVLAAGGTPSVGLKLSGLLQQAGFLQQEYSIETTLYKTPSELQQISHWYLSLLTGRPGDIAVKEKLLTAASLKDLRQQLSIIPYLTDAMSIVVWTCICADKPLDAGGS